MSSESHSALDRSHPSFGTARAAFLMALTGPEGVARFILVEAMNPAAVATVELLSQAGGGEVGRGCRVLGVFRDFREVGIRDDLLEEVPYVDFMTDIADADLILGNARIAASFSASLTSADRDRARAKARLSRPVMQPPAAVALPPPPPPPPPVSFEPTTAMRLESTLVAMGFKRGDVRAFVIGLGARTARESLEALVREGLSALAPVNPARAR